VLFRAKIDFNSSPWKQGCIPSLVLVKVFLVFSHVELAVMKGCSGFDLRKCDLCEEYREVYQR